MSEPCSQAEEIGKIKATLTFFQEAERRREGREERIAASLEQIAAQGAAQGATIAAQGDTLLRFEKSFMEAFLRLRRLEGSTLISRLFTGKRGPYIFGALIALSIYGVVRMDGGTLDKLERIIKIFTGGVL